MRKLSSLAALASLFFAVLAAGQPTPTGPKTGGPGGFGPGQGPGRPGVGAGPGMFGGSAAPLLAHFVTHAENSTIAFGMLCEFLDRRHDDKPLVILDTLGRAKPARPPSADPYQFDYNVGARLKAAVDASPAATLRSTSRASPRATSADTLTKACRASSRSATASR